MTSPVTIKKLIVLVKLSDNSVREIILWDEVKKEIFKTINSYPITVGEDLSGLITIKK